MSMQAENPRAVAGANEAPDYAQRVTADMKRDYAEYEKSVGELLNEARAAPAVVNDDETMGTLASIVKRLRDAATRGNAFRIKEKEPYLRGGNAVDQFFGALMMKCERQKNTDKPGAADILHARVHDWNERKLAKEKADREEKERLAADELRRAEDARRAEEQRLADEEKKRIDAIAAAEQAKRPVTAAKHTAAAAGHSTSAATQAGKVEAARANEDAARASLSDAKAANAAKPADMVRTRLDDGILSTMAQEPYAEVVDVMSLDMETLRPFYKDVWHAGALKAWATVTGHKKQLAGAKVGFRNNTVIR